MGERINKSNPQQMRDYCRRLESENESLTEALDRAESLVFAKNHKHAQQLVSRAKCRLEAFVFGFIGTALGGGFLYAVLSWAEWASRQCGV